ncbi:helix-turn-helix transcriptional regulator [Streptomyces smyrnaeus]|uniref:HTH luxR-type domain-containing protein n=1 Tax=Streptomyces smyrnaeus TaxID=1387713 RepID=A0ABS3Y784_9ACTN|nr:LuxR C-terminal-related transcriptional regulator [Streptomyces smyrnaeus]MBO8203181.1 hypothetical protein [Streptomyces smyrnaeus]
MSDPVRGLLTRQEQRIVAGVAAGTRAQRMSRGAWAGAASKLGTEDDAQLVAAAFSSGAIGHPSRTGPTPRLTPSEGALVHLLLRGLPAEDIAPQVGRSINDVKASCRSLQAKLGARTPAHLVTRLHERGLCTCPQKDIPPAGTAGPGADQ